MQKIIQGTYESCREIAGRCFVHCSRGVVLSLILLLPLAAAAQQPTLDLLPDPGFRVDTATTRKAVMRNDTLFLYYGFKLWTGGAFTSQTGLAISTDAPDYNTFVKVDRSQYPLYNFYLMPDGITRRQYEKQPGNNHLTSLVSTDNWTFAPEPGIRYQLHASDDSTFGVSTVVVDAAGQVHLYYIGDMWAVNNTRHALSTDGGSNFTFQGNNVCGDFSGPGTSYSHVDPDVVLLSGGSIRLVTMNPNGYVVPPNSSVYTGMSIHSFLSQDNGMTFLQESNSTGNDTLVRPSDFTTEDIHSLHDPKIVELPDGRVKIFMNGSVFTASDSLYYNIYSVTSAPPASRAPAIAGPRVRLYPNPVSSLLHVSVAESEVELSLQNLQGRVLGHKLCAGELQWDLSALAPGIYLVSIVQNGKPAGFQKLLKY